MLRQWRLERKNKEIHVIRSWKKRIGFLVLIQCKLTFYQQGSCSCFLNPGWTQAILHSIFWCIKSQSVSIKFDIYSSICIKSELSMRRLFWLIFIVWRMPWYLSIYRFEYVDYKITQYFSEKACTVIEIQANMCDLELGW